MGAGAAQAQEYRFTGATYDLTIDPTDCTVAASECVTYSVGGGPVTGVVEVSSQLISPSTFQDARSLVTAFEFSDGVRTYSSTDPRVTLARFRIRTDAEGAPVRVEALVRRWNTTTPAADGGDNAHYSTVDIVWSSGTANETYVLANILCEELVADVSPAQCATNATSNTSRAYARGLGAANASAGAWTFVAPPTIPTMSEWTMIALFLGLAGWGAWWIQRRRTTSFG